MLKVFSNQLRKIGKQVQNLVTDQISSDNRSDFFNIGEYYLKNKRYSQGGFQTSFITDGATGI